MAVYLCLVYSHLAGAGGRIRTPGLLITKHPENRLFLALMLGFSYGLTCM